MRGVLMCGVCVNVCMCVTDSLCVYDTFTFTVPVLHFLKDF